MVIKVINKSKHNLPEYATKYSAGLDLKTDTDEPVVLKHMERYMFPTGLYVAIPEGYVGKIYARSGLACQFGVGPSNFVGVIDSDYRGEIKVSLTNFSEEALVIKPGERVAQFILEKFEPVEWEEVSQLDETERGDGGFGHSGK